MGVSLLWAGDDATVLGVVPFFLDKVGVVIPGDISTVPCRCGGKGEVAFVADFLPTGVHPGVEERVGGRFHLFVRSHVDGAIGIVIVGAGRCIAALHTTYIRHGRIDGVGAEEAVIATKCGETALRSATNRLVLRGKDKENVRDIRCPTVHILCIGYFVLDVTVL